LGAQENEIEYHKQGQISASGYTHKQPVEQVNAADTAGSTYDWASNNAATKLQAHFRGMITRQVVAEQYGFKANVHNPDDDASQLQAQHIVQEIRQQLGDFNFEPAPADYNSKQRVFKQQEQLENGARYEGEWDSTN